MWEFERDSVAYKTLSNAYGNTPPGHSMDLVGVNMPRVGGPGGGLLIEGSTVQLHGLTEAFVSWTQTGTCAVTTNDYVAPNGTLTADKLDNTGGVSTDKRYLQSSDFGDLTGRTFTLSVWARADTPHTCSMYIYEQPDVGMLLPGGIYDIKVTREWQRFCASGTAAGGGNGILSFGFHPGESGVATGIAHFWGANLTETTFPTSYFPNAGAATTQLTREADDIVLDPHPAGSSEIILPEFFTPAGPANKLSMFLEAKCQYSGSAEMGIARNIIEISGNTGTASATRNRFRLYVLVTGRIYMVIRDDAEVDHLIQAAIDVIPYNDWFSVRAVFDFADFSRQDMWINGSNAGMTYAGGTGTGTFDTTNTLVRLGQNLNGTITGSCWIRNLRIAPYEVRP